MKKIISFIVTSILLCMLLSTFVGCKSDDTLKICEVTHSIFYAPQYVAMAKGYFKDNGIEIELTNGSGADNVMTALLTGEADIGLMGPESNIYVATQGKTNYPKVIAQLTKRDGSFLVSRNSEQNFDYTNLSGKTILMGRKGGMPAMILQYILNNNGYTNGENITMDYTIQFGLLAPVFTGGTGDYVPLFEPTASEIVTNGQGYIVRSLGKDSGEIPYTCYTVTSKYLSNNRTKVELFVKSVWQGTDYVLTHTPRETAELISQYFTGTSVDILEKAIENYINADVWKADPRTSESAFNRLQDIMENAGELVERASYGDIVDNSVVDNL